MVDAVLLKDTFAVLSVTAVSKLEILGIATVPVKVGFSFGAFKLSKLDISVSLLDILVALVVILVVLLDTFVFVVFKADVSALLLIAVVFVAISVSLVVTFVFNVIIFTPLILAPNPSSPPKTVSPVLLLIVIKLVPLPSSESAYLNTKPPPAACSHVQVSSVEL